MTLDAGGPDETKITRRAQVTIGPIPAASVSAWAVTAERTIAALRERPEAGVPGDVVVAFERYVTEWRELAAAIPTFRWTGDVDVDEVRRLASYWVLLANVARIKGHASGIEPAPATAQPFYDALIAAMTQVLGVDDDDPFADRFEEVVPAFEARLPSELAAPGPRHRRVLIVDDTEDIRLLLRIALLSDPALSVFGEVANGREALDAVAAGCPDAILLDVMMPVMDGLTALPLLMEQCPAARIVIVTAAVTPQLRAEALSRGAFAVIDKKESFGELTRVLSAA